MRRRSDPKFAWAARFNGDLTSFRKILIIKLSSVGDVVLATPVVQHLKSLSGASISWAIDEGIAPLLRGHPLVDDLLLFPRDPFRSFPGGSSRFLPKMARLVARLRERPFDLAIDLQGRGRSYLLLQLARAHHKIGRGHFPFLRQTVPHRRHIARHAVEETFEATDLMNLPRPLNRRLVLREFAEDRQRVQQVLHARGVQAPVSALVPGTTWPSKRWPADHWAEVADWLAQNGQWVILVGSAQERSLQEKILLWARSAERIIPFFGTFNLRELISLFGMCRMVVSCDTGPMHIAMATAARVVALFGPTDPVRTGPWPPGRAQVIQAPDCSRCRLPRCGKRCMYRLLPREVIPVLAAILACRNDRPADFALPLS